MAHYMLVSQKGDELATHAFHFHGVIAAATEKAAARMLGGKTGKARNMYLFPDDPLEQAILYEFLPGEETVRRLCKGFTGEPTWQKARKRQGRRALQTLTNLTEAVMDKRREWFLVKSPSLKPA